MLIVLNLSMKKIEFNLFESFFYNLRNDGSIVFVDEIDNVNIDYDSIRINIQNILYEYHVSKFSLCVLYDMSQQVNDPLKFSISSNIYNIKEKIIKYLSHDYTFNKLYYLSLDSVDRDNNFVVIDDNVRMAIDFDTYGYVNKKIDSSYMEILFSKDEIELIDRLWDEMKRVRYTKVLANEINNNDLYQMMVEFTYLVSSRFESKIMLIKDKYSELLWYADRLSVVCNKIIDEFKIRLYKCNGMLNLVDKPSELIKGFLKMEVSNCSDDDVVIIRVLINDKNGNCNKEVLRYRHQLEVVALLLYLVTNDMKFIFNGNHLIDRINHFEVKVELDDTNLYRMLGSYSLKLREEIARISKFVNNEIEYKEFAPRMFNVSREMDNLELPAIPSYSLFPNKRDSVMIEVFADKLFKRYLKGVDYAGRRIALFTSKLRVQKEGNSLGELKKGNITYINAIIAKKEEEIRELEKRIAVYKPSKLSLVDEEVKKKYDDIVNEIKLLMNKRIEKGEFIRNLILMIIVLIGLSIFINVSGLSLGKLMVLTFIIPIGLYILLMVQELNNLKYKINKKVNELVECNKKVFNEVFSKDREILSYIENIYNLIMLKKYVNECRMLISECNKKFKQFNYHYDKLNEHLEINNKLMELLNVKEGMLEQLKIDKIKNLVENEKYDKNPLYCPLSYLMYDEEINNYIVMNDSQNILMNSKLLGFVKKIVITSDKEYDNCD